MNQTLNYFECNKSTSLTPTTEQPLDKKVFLVRNEVSFDKPVGVENFDIQPKKRGEQTDMKQISQGNTPSGIGQLPSGGDHKKHVHQHNGHTDVNPDNSGFVCFGASTTED